MRVHELREKKDDEISLSMARMLMKELNMRVDDLKSTTPIARNKLQQSVVQSNPMIETTAANTNPLFHNQKPVSTSCINVPAKPSEVIVSEFSLKPQKPSKP
jgi:hypothetical protein